VTQIIVIVTEGDGEIGVSAAGNILLDQAVAYCEAAARHFQELSIEAEIQRRVAALQTQGAALLEAAGDVTQVGLCK